MGGEYTPSRPRGGGGDEFMNRVRDSLPTLVGEACFVALTWLSAGIAYLLSRHAAISPLFWAGVTVVAAEVTYAVNTYHGRQH